jgi:hypothetical protein
LTSDTTSKDLATAKTDPARDALEPVAGLRETDADDMFLRWLRDEKSAPMDWNTFGIETVHSNKSHLAWLRHSPKCQVPARLFPSVKLGGDDRV